MEIKSGPGLTVLDILSMKHIDMVHWLYQKSLKLFLTHEFAINTFKLIPLPRHTWKKPFPSHYMLSVFQVLILYLVQKLYYRRSTRQGEPHPC